MADSRELVLRDVEVDGRPVDVRVVDAVVTAVGPGLRPSPGADVVDGGGGALVPGLHDHHIHLLATAAARRSVAAGPADVGDQAGLAAALRAAGAALPPGRWVRAVGYHASVAGDLDRRAVDALVADRPVRIQHRSGARWVLNSAAVDALGLDERDHPDRPGVERDAAGRATGRLHRADGWLRPLVAEGGPPDLAPLGALLTGYGVTGVTDTTPYTDLADLAALSGAVLAGALPQRVVVTGGPELAGTDPPEGLEWGPVKLVIDDADYPALDALADQVGAAHGHGRSVAVHCVTRAALVLALAAWEVAGARPGDRVEHGAVIPPELVPDLRRHGLTVVTQPGFVAERGDEYRAEVDAADLPHLYPCRSLIAAGVAVAASTDAPYSDPDPWRAVAAAVARRTRSGAVLDAGEAVTPRRALDLFLSGPQAPGGPPRRVVPGAAADLCLLDRPLGAALADPASLRVACTIRRGRISPRPS
jgi:predicted amidohydrolase YtcJ